MELVQIFWLGYNKTQTIKIKIKEILIWLHFPRWTLLWTDLLQNKKHKILSEPVKWIIFIILLPTTTLWNVCGGAN